MRLGLAARSRWEALGARMMQALAIVAIGMGACMSETPVPAKTERAPSPAIEVEAVEPTKAVEPSKAVEPTKAVAPVEAGKPPVAAEPSPSALAVTLPAVDDRNTPAAVYAAQVESDQGGWVVDIVDTSGIDMARIEEQLRVGADELELKAGDPLLPSGFDVGDPWTLVTRAGAEQRTAKGFQVSMTGESATLHFYVQLGKAPKQAEDPVLAFRGHLPAAVELVVPAAIRPAELAPGTLDRINKAFMPELARVVEEELPDTGVAKIIASIELPESRVELFPGRFPGGRTHVGFVLTERHSRKHPVRSAWALLEETKGNAEVLRKELPGKISGAVLAKADGTVEVLRPAGLDITVELLGLLDVDGDGLDEVFYADWFGEGYAVEMIQWDGDLPKRRTLTGDS